MANGAFFVIEDTAGDVLLCQTEPMAQPGRNHQVVARFSAEKDHLAHEVARLLNDSRWPMREVVASRSSKS